MAVPIKIPDIGTTVEEVAVYSWLVEEGDAIARGDVIAEIETDKAIVEFESPVEGVLLQKVVPEGGEAGLGDIIAWVGEPGESVPDGLPAADPSRCGTARLPGSAQPGEPRAAGSTTAAARPHWVDERTASGPGSATRAHPQGPDFLLSLYRQMVLIRQFEERVKFLFLEGIMPGTIHQYQGQEAIAVGVCAALNPDDVITSTHRPHGHALAKGLSAESLMHELFGKATGCCRGRGGSMHVGDLSRGMVPAIAIVGGGVPIATGMALAFRMRNEPRVAVCFMGDGAINEGAFHEGVNMGAIWSLPVVYVIENNRYSASTPIAQMVRVQKLSDRAVAYGIPGVTVDGNDVLAVLDAASEAVARARAGGGPTLIEAMTYRITGHSRRDPCNYQPAEERAEALRREPIGRFAAYLLSEGLADQDALDAVRQEVDAQIEHAVESAMAAPDPAPEEALEGLFAER
jgi:pyruvate dehydrogenase E1 component alpha subunit